MTNQKIPTNDPLLVRQVLPRPTPVTATRRRQRLPHTERRRHLEVFGIHNLPRDKQAPVGRVHFDGREESCPPSSTSTAAGTRSAASTGSRTACAIVDAVEYRLAPESAFPDAASTSTRTYSRGRGGAGHRPGPRARWGQLGRRQHGGGAEPASERSRPVSAEGADPAVPGGPPATVFTCGFDPLRDVGVEYARKLTEAGNAKVVWKHYPGLTHGFLQMAPWRGDAGDAVGEVARVVRELVG
ncbi:L-xylulose reductase [Hypoxylon texense]